MHYKYITKNTCSKIIEYDVNNEIVTNIKFTGGCPGNLQLLAKIFDGKHYLDIIKVCRGNMCRDRGTSCADQLANSLEENIKIKQEEA